MVRACSLRALAAAVVALTALPGAVDAQVSLPPLPAAGGGVTDRLSPEDVERANQRRLREQVVSRLRELQARGEYTEMLRLIQEAEKTLPNDMVLKQYGYMAQMGLESVAQSDRPLVSPNSPALRRTDGTAPSGLPAALPGAGTAGTGLSGTGMTGTAMPGTGLPPLPDTGNAAPSQSLPGLPPLPPAGNQSSAGDPSSSLPPLPTGLPQLPTGGEAAPAPPPSGETPSEADAASGDAQVTRELPADESAAGQESPVRSSRLIRNGAKVLLLCVGGLLVFLFRRRKESKAGRTAAAGRAAAGAAVPPPIPGRASSPGFSMRDALTEVDVSEEEVARDIAQNIGTRSAVPAVGTMPTFDMFIPEGRDAPTGFHENIPTMVEEEQNTLQDQPTIQDQPTLQEGPGYSLDPSETVPSSFSFLEEAKGAAPAVPPAPVADLKPAGGAPGLVSFADLGISFADDEPPASPVAPPPSKPATAPEPAAPAFVPPDLPPLDLGSLSQPAADKKGEAPVSSEPTPVPSLPGLPKGDEPIRLDDLNFFAPGSETATVSPSSAAPAASSADDMSATIDLSELLFGKLDPPSGASDAAAGPSDATRTSVPAGSPSARPASDETLNLSQSDRISLDLPADKSPAKASDETTIADLQNQETVQIPVLNEKLPPRVGEGHPDDSLAATVALNDPNAETMASTTLPASSGAPAAPGADKTASMAAPPRAEEQSYYASAPGTGGSMDERTERMFREQCERAEKALSEKNWEQAVRYLSVAAAIRPEDAEVTQKLRHAREQKRRQEASV